MNTTNVAAAVPLYPASIPPVNEPAFVFRKAADAVGVALEDIAGIAYQKICEHLGKEIPRSCLLVLRAFLSHANKEHNRVFASLAEIRDNVNALRRRPIAQSTIEEAVKVLVDQGILRRLWGDELMTGDGPHCAASRGIKRRGRFPVNTYDMSGLWRFLSGYLRGVLARAAGSLLSLVPPAPRNNIKASGSSRVERSASPSVPSDNGGESDLFLDPFLQDASAALYDVGIGIENPEQEAGKVAPVGKKQNANLTASRLPVPTPKNRDSDKGSRVAASLLRGVGLRGKVPGEIISSMGAAWAQKLVRYAAWRVRSGVAGENEPAVLVGVWRNHRDAPELHGWETGFERSEAARSRPPAPVAAPVITSAPVLPPAPSAPPVSGTFAEVREKLRRWKGRA